MAETAVKMKMWYEVEGQTFPPTLRGLTDAIKLACEFATPTSMAHVRKLGEDGRVRLDLPIGPCERSPRGGHITKGHADDMENAGR